MSRRTLIAVLLATAAIAVWARRATVLDAAQPARPNFVVFLTDDQGYGDLSSFGHPTIRTPNIDRMAAEGIRLTSFYAAPVCTPSRAQLLTGRYAFRSKMYVPYGPGAPEGLADDEITLADALKRDGYRTGMLGKWHLGDFDTRPEFNPLRHGFDVFLGIPYSHDYRRPFVPDAVRGVPLYRGFDQVERPVDANTLTARFTEEAVRFIREASGRPFFLYIAYNMPHLPAGASPRFQGTSTAGRYGDAVEEIDWSVGQVLAELKTRGLDERTMTLFFSDNGPWSNAPARSFQEGQTLWDAGSAGLLRGGKGTSWEGGMRVPAAARWPGTIPSRQVSSQMASELDVFPTFESLAGGQVSHDRPSDGDDLLPFLTGRAPTPRRELYYIVNRDLQGVREGRWKLRSADGSAPELYDLDRDPGERLDVASANLDVVAHLRERLDRFRPQVSPAAR
ncbi:MAG TPA: sulfatase [Vicinamibacterales bacterium]|jgi:arylsulfatase A-like enzyme